MTASFNLGTRASPLALAQAEEVKAKLLKAHPSMHPDDITIVSMTTTGDQILDRTLANAGGKGLFTKELEVALDAGEVDFVVHSSKDMPTSLPPGLVLQVFLEREDIRDAFIADGARCLNDLPAGAVVGTASLRRQALTLRQRPDLTVVPIRGNVQTRLKKLKAGEADATFLAYAGLLRLGMANVATDILPVDVFPPAPAQGAIGIEIREGDTRTADFLEPLNHLPTKQRVEAERAFLGSLDGSCRTPIAAVTTLSGDHLTLKGQILSLDGQICHAAEATGDVGDCAAVGRSVGDQIRAMAGDAFFQALADQLAQSEAPGNSPGNAPESPTGPAGTGRSL